MDLFIILIGLAVILQILAVIFAFNLIRLIKNARGWILISIALLFMGFSRINTFFEYISIDLGEDTHRIFNFIFPIIISITMILGIYFLSDVFRDKTRIERKLKETEHFENVLLNNIWTGIWVVDTNNNFVYFNKAMEKISGLTSKQVIGTNLLNSIPEHTVEGDAHFRDFYLQAKNSLEITSYDSIPIITPQGNLSYQSGDLVPILNDNGEYDGMICTVEDVTGHIKNQAAIKESEERFRMAFEEALIGMALVLPDGRWLKINKALCDILGYTESEILAMDFWTITHPDDLDSDLKYLKMMLKGTVQTFEKERRFLTKDGEIIWAALYISIARDADGKVLHFIVQIKNITDSKLIKEELQLNESRMEALLELHTMTQATYKEIIHFVMDKGVKLTKSKYGFIGLMNEDESVCTIQAWSEDVMDDCRMSDKPIEYTTDQAGIWAEAVRQHRPIIINDYSSHDPDKKGIPEAHVQLTRLIVIPVFDNDKVIALATVANKDKDYDNLDIYQVTLLLTGMWQHIKRMKVVDELNRLNDELEERVIERTDLLNESKQALLNLVDDFNSTTINLKIANERLLELDRMKSMFIASTSHELRTPLNSIIGFSSILIEGWEGELNQGQKEQIDLIHTAGKQLLALINDIIDISKIEAGKLETEIQEFGLKEVMDEAVSLVKNDIDEKGLDLKMEVQDTTIVSDRRRLLQCLINLMSNAVKFTDKGMITLQAKNINNMTSISITDTGPGIMPDDIKKLFAPFVRLESSLSAKTQGTGLGLYLTKKLTEDVLGGKVDVTSEYGTGSTFTLDIPVKLEIRDKEGEYK
jgi:PAS domain S-box-containing protein